MISLNRKKTVINPAESGAKATCMGKTTLLVPCLALAQVPTIISTYPAQNALNVLDARGPNDEEVEVATVRDAVVEVGE